MNEMNEIIEEIKDYLLPMKVARVKKVSFEVIIEIKNKKFVLKEMKTTKLCF